MSTSIATRTVQHGEYVFASAPVLVPLAASPGLISARAAFQELLSGTAVLLDTRPARVRRRDGQVGGGLPVFRSAVPVPRGVRVIELEPSRRAPGALAIDGGMAAWRAAGMPVQG